MPLSPNSRLGPYLILAPLGAGGMGEVYRARDTRLDRDVAIKVLPASVANDPDRRARFEREAKAVAALSHPNILAIFDTGVADGVAYVATELLTGETLRDRLQAGAMPIRKSADTAIQIARGLGAAHQKGLVHRDLKPENVFLVGDGQVKILDFGLAKTTGVGPGANAETVAMTDPGMVMGTVGYMAPEQIRGELVDARADLFALGAVLYEMLSGQRAFRRETPAETMTAILKDDPPELTETRAELPSGLDRIVRHALEKNPAERFQTARDIAFALESLSGSGTAAVNAIKGTAHSRQRRTGFFAAAVMLAVIAGVAAGAWWNWRVPAPVRKLNLVAEKLETGVSNPPVISPDGTHVAFYAAGSVFVRALDSLDAVEIPNSKSSTYPSWSPDGTAIAFVKESQLWRVNIASGKAVTLGTVPGDMGGSGGICWLPDGRLILSGSNTIGLSSISERGGDLTHVLELDSSKELDFHELSPLPGGGVLFTVHRLATQRADTIDALVDGKRTTVLQLKGENIRRPTYSPTGHLLYQRETLNPGIWAVKFSIKTLTTEGEPFLIEPSGSWPSLSDDGTLAFVRPTTIRPDLVWVDRAGTISTWTPLPQLIADYGGNRFLSLSPDGKRVLITLQIASAGDLWMYDSISKTMTQVSHNAGQATSPAWLPDGAHAIVAASFSNRFWNLQRVSLNDGAVERLTEEERFQYSTGVSADGRLVTFGSGLNNGTLWSMALDPSGHASAPVRIGGPQGLVDSPAVSPDGRFVAYVGFGSGQNELFVQAIAPGAEPRRVMAEGAFSPVWSRDGHRLLFRHADDLMSADVSFGAAGPMFSAPVAFASAPVRDGFSVSFDVAADGRVLMTRTAGRDQLALVLNWPDELRRIEKAGVGR